MNTNVRIEEVTTMSDFILTSYTRDFDVIKSRFVKMDNAFRDGFVTKLGFVKQLESTLMLNETRKGVTESLYAESKQLNDDLNFLSIYFVEALLNPGIVTALKSDLYARNIEGALLKIEGLKQFIVAHETILTDQGMAVDFATVLEAYKVSLTQKNNEQNALINNRKQLTDSNQTHYAELLKMVRKIIRNGKLVFKGKVTQDEYTLTKLIRRMRAAPKKDVPMI